MKRIHNSYYDLGGTRSISPFFRVYGGLSRFTWARSFQETSYSRASDVMSVDFLRVYDVQCFSIHAFRLRESHHKNDNAHSAAKIRSSAMKPSTVGKVKNQTAGPRSFTRSVVVLRPTCAAKSASYSTTKEERYNPPQKSFLSSKFQSDTSQRKIGYSPPCRMTTQPNILRVTTDTLASMETLPVFLTRGWRVIP